MKRIGSKHAGTDNRKKEIIQAALECFTKAGTTNTSISDICRKSKVSTGSLYHHFKSKENLAAAIYLEGIAMYQDGYVQALEASTNARSGIFAVIAYHLDWVEQNTQWATFIVRERHAPFMGDNEYDLNRLNREFITKISGWFRRHIESGSIKRLPPELYQIILMGPVQEYVKSHMLCGKKPDLAFVSQELGKAAWAALKSLDTDRLKK